MKFQSMGIIASAICFAASLSSANTNQSYPELNKIVNDCAASVPEGYAVERSPSEFAHSAKPTEVLSAYQGRVKIQIGVQLRYASYFSNEEFKEAVELIEEAKPLMQEYYSQYGLDLQITFYHEQYNPTSLAGHGSPPEKAFITYIRRNTGEHMKSLYWGVNRHWPKEARARIYTHEISHHLSLKDEYETRMAERIGEEDNIMNNWDHPEARFYPHQIRQLIAPLCDN